MVVMVLFDQGGRFTEVLMVSTLFRVTFFYILFIRDFLRKRISKGQNLSKMIL